MAEATNTAEFWAALEEATDPTAYKPARNEQVIAARLEARDAPYYILKEPLTRSYLRLTEADYAVWWQMDGRAHCQHECHTANAPESTNFIHVGFCGGVDCLVSPGERPL